MSTELDATIIGTTEFVDMKEFSLEREYSGRLTLADHDVEKSLLITPALPSTKNLSIELQFNSFSNLRHNAGICVQFSAL